VETVRVSNEIGTIAELQQDIAAMEATVLYYQNRILRKRIAIEEILQGEVCRQEVKMDLISVRQMIQDLITEEPNRIPDYEHLKKRCIEKYPEQKRKIHRGMWQACHQLISRGVSITMPQPRLLSNRNHAVNDVALARSALCLAAWLILSCLWCQAASVTLAWNPSTDSTVTGYKLYQSAGTGPFNLSATVTGTTTTVTTDTNQVARFYATAFNASGVESVPSNVVTNFVAVPPPPTNLPPPAPTNLRANLVQGHRLDIGWQGVSAVSEVERSIEGGPFTRVASVPPGVFHFSDTSIRKQWALRYRVRQVNQYGTSPYSNELYYSSQ